MNFGDLRKKNPRVKIIKKIINILKESCKLIKCEYCNFSYYEYKIGLLKVSFDQFKDIEDFILITDALTYYNTYNFGNMTLDEKLKYILNTIIMVDLGYHLCND